MLKKLLFASVAVFISMCLAGCLVTQGTYLKKVDEADNLNKKVALLEQRTKELSAENDKLKKDNDELDKVLKARADDLSMKISDQKARISDLEDRNAALKKEIAELQKSKEEKIQEVSKTYGEMLEKMKTEIAQGQVTITELKGRLTVNMVDSILFDSGRAEVKADGLTVLQKVVDVLKGVRDKAIRIEGHTDNIRIKGALAHRYPTNWELSAARALNVARYLQQQGIDPGLLSAVAFGEYKPIAKNDTSEGRARNRRIEIILVPKD
ncbi:MAG: OmpA family protein [Syntrophales bacterium]